MKAKQLFEKMIDFRQFGIVLLTVGAFFYIGSILPSDSNTMTDQYISLGACAVFLSISGLFFTLSKNCKAKLAETEEGQEFLMNQKRP